MSVPPDRVGFGAMSLISHRSSAIPGDDPVVHNQREDWITGFDFSDIWIHKNFAPVTELWLDHPKKIGNALSTCFWLSRHWSAMLRRRNFQRLQCFTRSNSPPS